MLERDVDRVPPVMTDVLLALDETDESHLAALTATVLFGPDANYLAVHAEPSPAGTPVLWGPVYGYPYPAVTTARLGDPDLRRQAIEEARLVAAQQAGALGIDATPVGEVGDPADAIKRVAHDHRVDVVVVGAHHRSWFRQLFDPSVTADLIESAAVPILVVPSPTDE